jgi:hypothetical protein
MSKISASNLSRKLGNLSATTNFSFKINIPSSYLSKKENPECDEFYLNYKKGSYIFISKNNSLKKCVELEIDEQNNSIYLSSLYGGTGDNVCSKCFGSTYLLVSLYAIKLLLQKGNVNARSLYLADVAEKHSKNVSGQTATWMEWIKTKLSDITHYFTNTPYPLTSYNWIVNGRSFYEGYGFVPILWISNVKNVIIGMIDPYHPDYIVYFKHFVKTRKLFTSTTVEDLDKLFPDEKTYNEFFRVPNTENYIFFIYDYNSFNNYKLKLHDLFKKYKLSNNVPIKKYVSILSNDTDTSQNTKDKKIIAKKIVNILSPLIYLGLIKMYAYPAGKYIPKILEIYKANDIPVFQHYYKLLNFPINDKLNLFGQPIDFFNKSKNLNNMKTKKAPALISKKSKKNSL